MSGVPYGDGGGFTPYQPGPEPTPEPEEGLAPPAVTHDPASRRRSGMVALVVGGGVAAAGIVVGVLIAFASDGTTTGPDGLLADELRTGQCLIGAGLDPNTDDSVSDLETVDCSTAHDAEVLAVNVLDEEEAAAYDIEDDDQIDTYCRPFLDPDQRRLFRESDEYFLLALTELREPETGDHVACLLTRSDGGPLHEQLG